LLRAGIDDVAAVGADCKLCVVVADLPDRRRLRKDDVELVVEISASDKIVEAAIGVVDLNAVNRRASAVDSSRDRFKALAFGQPCIARYEVADTLRDLFYFARYQHYGLAWRMMVLFTGGRTMTLFAGGRTMVRSTTGR
jgi:hypothetical protein